ncbi:hypothetical protein K461DRAFT_28503 [Myriangium duriaei CBS 260.36]|uniref:Uncharacterized protein n=1 Tax=Myriangium duriaei CBS 260.36 TaxID=1168546 RepID=A0A9P4JCD5_9PEZI|nr:hypothetical protein K461DRAFT_28503 [Myriangium duriaei CBS 260.36]
MGNLVQVNLVFTRPHSISVYHLHSPSLFRLDHHSRTSTIYSRPDRPKIAAMTNQRLYKPDTFDDCVEEAASMIASQPIHIIRHLIQLIGFQDKGMHDNYLADYVELSLPSQTISVQQQAVNQVEHYRRQGQWAQAILVDDTLLQQQHATPVPIDPDPSDVEMTDFNTPHNICEHSHRPGNPYITPHSLGNDNVAMESDWADIDRLPDVHREPSLAFDFSNWLTGLHHRQVGGELDNLDLTQKMDPFAVTHLSNPLPTSTQGETTTPRRQDTNSFALLTPLSILSFRKPSPSVPVEDDRASDLLHDGRFESSFLEEQVESRMSTPCPQPANVSPGSQLLSELNVARLQDPSSPGAPSGMSFASVSVLEADQGTSEVGDRGTDRGPGMDASQSETEPLEDVEARSGGALHPRSEVAATEANETELGRTLSPGILSLEPDEALTVKSKDARSGVVGGARTISTPLSQSESRLSTTPVASQAQSPQHRTSSIIPSIERQSSFPSNHRNHGNEYITPMPDVHKNLSVKPVASLEDQLTRNQNPASNKAPHQHVRASSVSPLSDELRDLLAAEQANGIRNSDQLFCYSPTPPLFDEMSVHDTDEQPATPHPDRITRRSDTDEHLTHQSPAQVSSHSTPAEATNTASLPTAARSSADVILISDDEEADCVITSSSSTRKRKRTCPSTQTKLSDKPVILSPGTLSHADNALRFPAEALLEQLSITIPRTQIQMTALTETVVEDKAATKRNAEDVEALRKDNVRLQKVVEGLIGRVSALERRGR